MLLMLAGCGGDVSEDGVTSGSGDVLLKANSVGIQNLSRDPIEIKIAGLSIDLESCTGCETDRDLPECGDSSVPIVPVTLPDGEFTVSVHRESTTTVTFQLSSFSSSEGAPEGFPDFIERLSTLCLGNDRAALRYKTRRDPGPEGTTITSFTLFEGYVPAPSVILPTAQSTVTPAPVPAPSPTPTFIPSSRSSLPTPTPQPIPTLRSTPTPKLQYVEFAESKEQLRDDHSVRELTPAEDGLELAQQANGVYGFIPLCDSQLQDRGPIKFRQWGSYINGSLLEIHKMPSGEIWVVGYISEKFKPWLEGSNVTDSSLLNAFLFSFGPSSFRPVLVSMPIDWAKDQTCEDGDETLLIKAIGTLRACPASVA